MNRDDFCINSSRSARVDKHVLLALARSEIELFDVACCDIVDITGSQNLVPVMKSHLSSCSLPARLMFGMHPSGLLSCLECAILVVNLSPSHYPSFIALIRKRKEIFIWISCSALLPPFPLVTTLPHSTL